MPSHQLRAQQERNELQRGEPRELPPKRPTTIHKAKINGVTVLFSVGEYNDGTPGEIFIDISKGGTTLRSLYNCLAIAVSIGLRYGVPLKEYVSFFANMAFEPNGYTDGDKKIGDATSIVDYIFRMLGAEYLRISAYGKNPDQKTKLLYQKDLKKADSSPD